MDLDALLGDISEDAPSGENLEYDPEFTALELAAEIKEAHQIGDEVVEATPPDYPAIREQAQALLQRSHDLRVAMHLAMAELSTTGFSGFAEVMAYVNRCLAERWESCHPELDADDDDDPTARVNATLALVDDAGILRALRRAPLTESRAFGRFSYRDIEFATGARTPPPDYENAVDMTTISAAFKDTDEAMLAELHETISAIREDVDGIDNTFTEMIPGQGPDLQPLKSLLAEIQRKLGEHTGGEVSTGDAGDDGDAGGAPAAAASSGGGQRPLGGVNGPDDVVRALDQILAYYAASEPSSPLPLLIQRAKRLVRADFMTIMKDIAPEGIDNVRIVGGLPDEDDDDYSSDDD